jgi:hypothetical protein
MVKIKPKEKTIRTKTHRGLYTKKDKRKISTGTSEKSLSITLKRRSRVAVGVVRKRTFTAKSRSKFAALHRQW